MHLRNLACVNNLIEQVMAFEVGSSNVGLSFIGRLCREQNWTRAYAGRAFREYKRFMLLTVLAGHPVTPSEEVDHVWHLHLLYTRSYWHELCRDILGQEIHHGPTLGGNAEKEKFVDWYEKTLLTYEKVFEERPPKDFWPSSRKRFRNAGDWKTYNAGRHFLMPKFREILKIFRVC